MAKYEIPETDYEAMTPAEADKAIEGVNADLYEDKEHPYMVSHHPQHKAYVDHVSNLHKASARKEGEPFDLQKAKDERDEADLAALRQQHLVNDAKEEMDTLVELGSDRDEIPEDVQPFQVLALKMERLNAQKNIAELVPMLEKELMTLGSSSDLDLFRSLCRDASIDPRSRKRHIQVILDGWYLKNKEIYGVK